MGRLGAVDPGKKAAVAVFVSGVLQAVAQFDGDDPGAIDDLNLDDLVCERPHSGIGRATVDDLIVLALRAGLICARIARHLRPRWVQPSTWKGQQSKAACHAKARKVLTPIEQVLFDSVGEDGKDAVSLGLWTLGR